MRRGPRGHQQVQLRALSGTGTGSRSQGAGGVGGGGMASTDRAVGARAEGREACRWRSSGRSQWDGHGVSQPVRRGRG